MSQEARIFYQEDCNLSLLEGKTIAIIGYGSQGHAHALNLKESGCNVIIGLYEGSKSWAKAEAQGFEVFTAAEAAKKADNNTLSPVYYLQAGQLYAAEGEKEKAMECYMTVKTKYLQSVVAQEIDKFIETVR